jgi:hypothetical protein
VVATPSTKAQTNCTVNYSAINSVAITNFTLFGTDSINLVWTVYQSGGSTTTITTKYGGVSTPGIYIFVLQLYCTNRVSGSIKASDEIQITRSVTGITTLTADKEITIAPNPFTSQTTISFMQEQTNTIVKIIDVLGNIVKTAMVTGKQLTLTKAELSAGTYFVQITDASNNAVNRKIIIQ